MVGLVIATHGHLADEMVHTAEQIVGPMAAVATCSIEPGSSPEAIRDQMRAAVRTVDSGDGVIVLADLFGGTPCNQSLMLCNQCDIEVVTGVNLPMLLKATSLRQNNGMRLSEMATALANYGQKNITCPTAMMRESLAAR
ncbi:MAG: PTS sugar transporter subunit IIA [Myxococcaceae bacterium]|nr:PTS sugar transporter subunit IIA [Myxococcaceae bacterium]